VSPRVLLGLLAVAFVAATACQRIPPEVSIPGFAEEKEATGAIEGRPFGSEEESPLYFRNQDAD
jgi:hypothetical protein